MAAFARAGVGRVIEIRVRRLPHVEAVDALGAGVFDAMRQVGSEVVICADYRFATPISPDVADAWSRVMRETNRRIALSALLLDPDNTMFNLQLERIVRCAGSPERRLFEDVGELRDWTDYALTEAERAGLSKFLLSHDS
jgi:hypothetical protein